MFQLKNRLSQAVAIAAAGFGTFTVTTLATGAGNLYEAVVRPNWQYFAAYLGFGAVVSFVYLYIKVCTLRWLLCGLVLRSRTDTPPWAVVPGPSHEPSHPKRHPSRHHCHRGLPAVYVYHVVPGQGRRRGWQFCPAMDCELRVRPVWRVLLLLSLLPPIWVSRSAHQRRPV